MDITAHLIATRLSNAEDLIALTLTSKVIGNNIKRYVREVPYPVNILTIRHLPDIKGDLIVMCEDALQYIGRFSSFRLVGNPTSFIQRVVECDELPHLKAVMHHNLFSVIEIDSDKVILDSVWSWVRRETVNKLITKALKERQGDLGLVIKQTSLLDYFEISGSLNIKARELRVSSTKRSGLVVNQSLSSNAQDHMLLYIKNLSS